MWTYSHVHISLRFYFACVQDWFYIVLIVSSINKYYKNVLKKTAFSVKVVLRVPLLIFDSSRVKNVALLILLVVLHHCWRLFLCVRRLDLARCSAANRCGLWGFPTALPSTSWRCSHPFLWLSAWIQHPGEISDKQAGTKMQPDEETWVCEGPTSRSHSPQAHYLVWGSTSNTFWCSPAGGYW